MQKYVLHRCCKSVFVMSYYHSPIVSYTIAVGFMSVMSYTTAVDFMSVMSSAISVDFMSIITSTIAVGSSMIMSCTITRIYYYRFNYNDIIYGIIHTKGWYINDMYHR